MPKMKTKSGAKKRFKITGTGKVLYAQSHKRHGMIKRTKKQIRQLRGTSVLFKTDGDNIKKYFLPNGWTGSKAPVDRAERRYSRFRSEIVAARVKRGVAAACWRPKKVLKAAAGLLRPPQEH